MTGNINKAKNDGMKAPSRKFTNYFSVFKGVKLPWILIAVTLIVSVVMMDSELEVASMTSEIIDSSQKAIDAGELVNYMLMTCLYAAMTIASNYLTRRMEEEVTFRVRVKLWNKIMRLPMKYYDSDNGNELVSRVTSDASAPASLFTTAVSCIVCTVTCFSAFRRLYGYNDTLASYSLIMIPVTAVICAVFGFLQFKLGVYSTATFAGSLGYLAERVRNFKLIKSAAAEKIEEKKGSGAFVKLYIADFLNWLVVAGYQFSSSLFSIAFIIIVFVAGSRLIPTGEITVAELSSFYMICGIVSVQLMQFFMNVGSVFETFGTMRKIARIMGTDGEARGEKSAPEDARDINFCNVSFSYDGEKEVLKNVSFTIPKGKVTAIVGGNGAGKTTVFKILSGLYEPTGGNVFYGDEDIMQYNLESWRDKFAYVSQNEALIGGTVRENIMYGIDREVSDEEIFDVAKRANCYDFITGKPDGINSDVGLDGGNFSGGQAQCISIARAMMRNSDCLLLDEATSNLDAVSTALVTDALDKLTRGKTAVMIAHSYAATQNADYVIVMSDGEVEAAGSPDELLKANEYYRLFSRQVG